MPAPISELVPLDRLVPYLAEAIPDFAGPVEVSQFKGGQSNPTFRLDCAAGAFVLRRKPPGVLLKSAHAVDREFRVQSALAGSAVPVAPMRHLCTDDAVIGAMFYVMDLVPGTAHDDPRLPETTPETRIAIFDEMNRVLAAVHDVDVDTIGLGDYGPPGDYFERQIGRWTKQYRASETEALPDMDALIDALGRHRPADDGQRGLVHGDFRLDNMIFDGTRCAALLDWELSTLGHPYADLASVIMQWRMPPGREGRGLAGVDRRALGIPSDADFVAAYCNRRGLPEIPQFGFYLAFSFFRMGAILQGVKKRALDGNAANPERGLKLGAHVPAFAAAGLAALDG